jgi:plasmid stabilization system protein ParE
MDSETRILWSEEALQNLEDILQYLEEKWTLREVENFKRKLSRQLEIIRRFPQIFPNSKQRSDLKKSVLSSQTSVFYQIKGKDIYIVYLFDNRQNPNKLNPS